MQVDALRDLLETHRRERAFLLKMVDTFQDTLGSASEWSSSVDPQTLIQQWSRAAESMQTCIVLIEAELNRSGE